MNYIFMCPKCRKERVIEQILKYAVVTQTVEEIEEDGTIEPWLTLDNPVIHDGEITHYQCASCGFVICLYTEDLCKHVTIMR
jgi:hypothetical protein